MLKKYFFTIFLLFFTSFAYLNIYSNNFSEDDNMQNEQQVVDSLDQKKESWFSLEAVLDSDSSLIYILLIAFIVGILASFTPCIYPMIPITMGILQSQAKKTLMHNFLLSCSYVTGLAIVYALLGYLAATTKLILGQWLVSPWFVGFLILFFLYFAFSMFGFYEIYIPKVLQRNTGMKVGGSLFSSFIFGFISGTVASPCLTPALALLLGFAAKRGNPIVGFLTLFVFSFGMGLILILVGTFSNTLTMLPRVGNWMVEIKKFFGFLMFGVAIYFVQPFIDEKIVNIMYLFLGIIVVIYYGFVISKKFISVLKKSG